tara:strand:+ start:403 stop:570 length:168 start_codon:yes stop_codon:yes gene_type:complete
MTDNQREQIIERYRLLSLQARDREERVDALDKMRDHINQRSPGQVKRMEIAQGLR